MATNKCWIVHKWCPSPQLDNCNLKQKREKILLVIMFMGDKQEISPDDILSCSWKITKMQEISTNSCAINCWIYSGQFIFVFFFFFIPKSNKFRSAFTINNHYILQLIEWNTNSVCICQITSSITPFSKGFIYRTGGGSIKIFIFANQSNFEIEFWTITQTHRPEQFFSTLFQEPTDAAQMISIEEETGEKKVKVVCVWSLKHLWCVLHY